MSCTYTYKGKTYTAWEFADVLAAMPADELAKYLPKDVADAILHANPSAYMYSFAGQSSATADAHALAAAQDRLNAGENAEKVRKETGWFKGNDSKWRYEISDADAKLQDRAQWTMKIDNLRAQRDGALKAKWEAEERRNAFLRLRGESPSRISADTKKAPEFKALAKAVKAAEAAAGKAQSAVFSAEIGDSLMTVGDILIHPSLFSAYPGIAGLKVEISRDLPAGNASYTYETQTIELSEDSSQAQLLSTLLHEIQHGIQHVEGFAMGGGIDTVTNLDAETKSQVAAVEKELRQAIKLKNSGEWLWEDSSLEDIIANSAEQKSIKDWAINVAKGGESSIKDFFASTPWEQYRRLAGEVEARNTQSRMNMTDAERRATPPSQTADVADSDVIVVFNGKEIASAPMPANAAVDQDTIEVDGVMRPTAKNSSIQASVSFSPLDYIERLEKSDSLISKKIGSILGGAVELGKDVIGADSAKTFNWWHKTIGSQMHKAKISPAFRRVFDRAQAFIDDVSKYATVAANEAPDLLPKMDSFFQSLRDAKNSIKDAKDQEAIAAPIFDGTLFEDENGNIVGKVWSDDELRGIYKLTDRQIDLYKQFRRAVDKSLDDLATSEMDKVARANELNDPPSGSRMTLDQLASFYRSQYAEKLNALEAEYDRISRAFEANDAQLKLNAERLGISREKYFETKTQMHADYAEKQRALLAEMEELQRMETVFSDKVETINKLKRHGYAPLMRFGKYTVDVVEMVDAIDEETGLPVTDQETGEIKQVENRIFFSMFETEREAREAERIMAEEYPDAIVTKGVKSEDGWQLFGKMNEGTLEALSKMIPSQDEVMQSFYKMAVSNRSALKRLIHRKGTEGYSKDVVRTLASFIMSNARASASFDHFGDIVEAAMEIPKEQGDVQKEAVKLINYIRDPNEEAGKFRGLLFMHFLGGSFASALVNLTQTISTTVPFLHQYGGRISDITKAGVLAAKRMAGGEATGIDHDLARALQLAEDEGIVAPHNIHALMGQTGTQGIAQHNRWFRLASHMWGSFFGMAEQFNRETAFISAYQLAKRLGDKGLKDAYDQQVKLNSDRGLQPPDRKIFSSPIEFAKNAVFETQFVLSKASRPNWARGAVGATLFTFKQFSVMYLELFNRLPNKERAIMLGALVLLAGIGGLPFGDDLEDLIDTMGQSAGYNTNSGKWKDDLIRDLLGNNKVASEFVLNGVTAFLPMDVANRLGMGNLLPATGLLKRSNGGNFGKEMSEFLGAGGAYARQIVDAWTAYQNTGRMSSLLQVAPKAIKDAAKGFEIASTGEYTDTRGRLVAEASGIDALVKMLGFQPVDIAAIQREKGYQMQDIALVKAVKASIAEMWAKGIYSKEPETKQKARELLDEWNAKNPEAKIRIDLGAVQRRVKQMGMTAAERLEKTAPKEMRRQVREAFAE